MSKTQNNRNDCHVQGGMFTTMPPALRGIPLHHDRVIDAGPVHLMTASGAGGAVIDPATPEYTLILLLRTAPLFRVGFNRQPRWLAASPGTLLFTPPDTDCEFIGEASGRCLCMVIPKERVQEFAQEIGVRIDLCKEEAFRDPRLMQQIAELWHVLATDGPATKLYADEVMRAVMETLSRRTGLPPKHSTRAGRECLPTHALRRVCEYIEHSLADDLEVTMMAKAANLSPAHFARAFAATVGMTPFRYVMTRRLARGYELLKHTRRSTLDIALHVGFRSPSHFTARFRAEFGVTPRAIRHDGSRSVLHMQA